MGAGYWACVVVAGAILATCLLVIQVTTTWVCGWVGLFLLVAALAYRPPLWMTQDDE